MFLTEESDLGSTESQPPSTRRAESYLLTCSSRKEVSASPA